MKPARFEYHAPDTLEEAISLRAELGSSSSILAGGQSLVPMLNTRLAQPAAIIDLRKLGELRYVRRTDSGIAVGALTTQRDVERSEEAVRACPLLREAQRYVAHAAIRNRGTIGGTVAHADPAAEVPAVLVLLDGEVTAVSARGERTIAARDLFRFHFTTTLEPDELISEVRFPGLPPGSGHAFVEFSRRHGDYPLAAATALVRDRTARLCFAACGPRPIVVDSDDEADWAAAIEPSSDVHAPAAYRRHLATVLARRALGIARERALGGRP